MFGVRNVLVQIRIRIWICRTVPVDLDPLGIGIVLADPDPDRNPGLSIWIPIYLTTLSQNKNTYSIENIKNFNTSDC
jgi:hypothetical protein